MGQGSLRASLGWSGKLDILSNVDPDRLKQATEAAASHDAPPLPALAYTEANPRWVLIYDHIRVGQIRPDLLEEMSDDDLRYIAGMRTPHPILMESDEGKDQATRLLGNVTRAEQELHRRLTRRNTELAASLALLGAGLLAVVGWLCGVIW